jgi:S-DNA-T family DNA segregation ATPase FtsK/SpoIIIE
MALYLAVALFSFHPDDGGWTHTGVGQVHNRSGQAGAWFADIAYYFCGYLAYGFPIAVALFGWRSFKRGGLLNLDAEVVFFRVLGFTVAMGSGCGLAALHWRNVPGYGSAGGVIGDIIGPGLIGTFSALGGYSFLFGNLFMGVLFCLALTLAMGRAWLELLELIGKLIIALLAGLQKLVDWLRTWLAAESSVDTATDKGQAGESKRRERGRRADLNWQTGASHKDDAPLATRSPQRSRIEPMVKLPADPVTPVQKPTVMLPVQGSTAPQIVSQKVPPNPPEEDTLAPINKPKPGQQNVSEPTPPLNLLSQPVIDQGGYSKAQLESMSAQVEMLLRDFGIGVRVAAVQPGPVITCFELDLAPGTKVSQISNLAKDLARGLSVLSVRVVEVVPGKSVVGLEIPNENREIVYLREILESPIYDKASSPMTLALGKDIGGHPVFANLGKMPHLLVAGTTGSGKSVAINAMLLSLLYKATPKEVRLILVDPKMLELSIYEDIPHLLAPVVTDMGEAANALRWCVAEMERRYQLMAALKVRNITGFNRKVSEADAAGAAIADPLYKPEDQFDPTAPAPTLEPLPFIVVVIDELADMMMIVGKKVEELIARLAQKARAAGIHLILATQRPSVDVITGLIKANIPTRIAFQVSSKVDSRTILDQMGAEQLLGYGDMLYLPPGTGLPKRVHGAFVDDHEVQNVVNHLRGVAEPDYVEEVLEEPSEPLAGFSGPSEGAGGDESDPFYDQAVRIVTESRRASISSVQRRLKIGYNRAARMIEEMEAAGIVSPPQSNGNREVLAPPPPDA